MGKKFSLRKGLKRKKDTMKRETAEGMSEENNWMQEKP